MGCISYGLDSLIKIFHFFFCALIIKIYMYHWFLCFESFLTVRGPLKSDDWVKSHGRSKWALQSALYRFAQVNSDLARVTRLAARDLLRIETVLGWPKKVWVKREAFLYNLRHEQSLHELCFWCGLTPSPYKPIHQGFHLQYMASIVLQYIHYPIWIKISIELGKMGI